MTAPASLPKLLQPALKALEKDLLARAKTERVEVGLKRAWEDEQKAGQTGLGFAPWRRERVTQLAVARILSVVFVRTLEDRGSVDQRVAGRDGDALRAAEDRETLFTQVAPALGPREYLLAVFRELAKLPGARDVFDAKHNPVWVLSPSSEGAKALLDFFRKCDASGAWALVFAGEDMRSLGDLYQDLSEAVRKRYALLQTPEFVEVHPRSDPRSGHRGVRAQGREPHRQELPTEDIADLARRALDQVYGSPSNTYITFSSGAAESAVGIRQAIDALAARALTWEGAARLVGSNQRSRVSKFQPCLPRDIEHGLIARETMNVHDANATLAQWTCAMNPGAEA